MEDNNILDCNFCGIFFVVMKNNVAKYVKTIIDVVFNGSSSVKAFSSDNNDNSSIVRSGSNSSIDDPLN